MYQIDVSKDSFAVKEKKKKEKKKELYLTDTKDSNPIFSIDG